MEKKTKFRISLAIGVLSLVFAANSNATLIDRGGGLIYDDVLNVTWLQDAGYSRTAGYAERMNWTNANSWAESLQYSDAIRGVVWDDWRLPRTINAPGSFGYDTTGLSSELAFMYYVNLGYAPAYSSDRFIPAPTSSLYNPFYNLAYRGFWSQTGSDYPDLAWTLHFHFGSQGLNGINDEQRVWALRDGDVSTSVPEPGALALFAIGLMGVGISRRKKAI